jgi:hypothetical protein
MKISNPLTIIAVFAGLAETLATVALVQLPSEIQIVFVYFVMAFPTCIVFLFFWILYHKNFVLYAPSDYQNQDHYLEANNLSEKIDEQVDLAFESINKKGNNISQIEINAVKERLSQVISSEVLSSLSNSILDALKDGPSTELQLAERLQCNRNSIRKATRKLEELFLIQKIRYENSMAAPQWKLII